jgi:hypothetical protein
MLASRKVGVIRGAAAPLLRPIDAMTAPSSVGCC